MSRDDFKKCKMCDREFAMAHNEDEDNQAEMECIEEARPMFRML